MRRLALLAAFVKRVDDWLRKLFKPRPKDPSGIGFTHWTGTYKRPDYTGREQGVLPKQLDCGQSFVIYIATATWEQSCVGFGGENDGNNANCGTSLQKANAAAAQVTCPSECPKQVAEIWRGWKCDKAAGDRANWAVCAVELEVTCPIGE